MNKEEITCEHCEAEFYVECPEEICYCVCCGEQIIDLEDGREE